MKSNIFYTDGTNLNKIKKMSFFQRIKLELALINEGSKYRHGIIDVYITPSKYRTIEYQGMDFGKIKTIKNNDNKQQSIFKNCSFKKTIYGIVTFNKGDFEFINPEVEDQALGFENADNVVLTFNTPSNYQVRFKYIQKTIKIKSNDSVTHLRFNDINDVTLEGRYKLKYFYMDENAQKASITGSSDKPTTLEFQTTNIINFIRAREVVLENCEIINRNEEAPLNILFEKLTYDTFLIKSKTRIQFGDYIVTTKDDKDYLNARVKSENIDKYIIVSRDKDGYITLSSEKYYQITNKQPSNYSLKRGRTGVEINPAWEKIKKEIEYYRRLLELTNGMYENKINELEGRLKAMQLNQSSYQMEAEQTIEKLLKEQDAMPKYKIRIRKQNPPLKKKNYTLPKE